jgi:hypothetical protein
MRELGRLLKQFRLETKMSSAKLIDVMEPTKGFDKAIVSVRKLCNFQRSKEQSVPSLALKIGHSLKKCAGIIRNKAIRENQPEVENRMKQYLKLHTSEWGSLITRYALDALEIKRTTAVLPVTEDLQVEIR